MGTKEYQWKLEVWIQENHWDIYIFMLTCNKWKLYANVKRFVINHFKREHTVLSVLIHRKHQIMERQGWSWCKFIIEFMKSKHATSLAVRIYVDVKDIHKPAQITCMYYKKEEYGFLSFSNDKIFVPQEMNSNMPMMEYHIPCGFFTIGNISVTSDNYWVLEMLSLHVWSWNRVQTFQINLECYSSRMCLKFPLPITWRTSKAVYKVWYILNFHYSLPLCLFKNNSNLSYTSKKSFTFLQLTCWMFMYNLTNSKEHFKSIIVLNIYTRS